MKIGREKELGIGIEALAGTSVAPQVYVPFLECSLQEMHEPIADNSAKGVRDAQGNDSVEGKKWGEGNVKIVLDAKIAPYLFALALGEVDTTANATYYTHTFTRKEDNPPLTATFWKGREVDSANFPYGVVNSLELEFSDDVASLNAEIISRYPVTQTRTSTYSALKYYTFRNAVVKVGASVGAVAEIKVKEFTLNINNNAEALHRPGDNDADIIPFKQFEVTGSFTVIFDNDDWLDAFKDLTKQALVIELTGGKIGSTNVDEKITITIPKFRVQKREEGADLDDLVEETIDFVAEYDDTDGTIKIEVKNDVDGYAAEVGSGS